MRRRRERSSPGFAERAARRGGDDHSVGVAVEARLFGRFRLLTIDAIVAIDGSEPPRPTVGDLSDSSRGSARRAEVEAVLIEARHALEVTTDPPVHDD